MPDVLVAAGLVVALLISFWGVFRVLPTIRVAWRVCPGCGHRFGREAASAAVPYYERLFGAGRRVMGGPRRYLGAAVVRCGGCGGEFVFGELGGLIEAFHESARPW